MIDFDEFTYEEHPPRTKAALDVDVSHLTYRRRQSMTGRRAANMFDYCSMLTTASMLRQLPRAADFEVSAASAALEAETE